MEYANESESEKLSKPEKQEQKKLDKAADRLEKRIEEKSYTKSCISVLVFLDFSILIGIWFITSSPFAIVVVHAYIILITLIALVPLMIEEYLNVGRQPPRLIRWFNSFLKRLLPMDRKTMGMGLAILLSYIYLVTIGGFIAIGIYTFADFLSNNPAIYDYLYGSGSTMHYGFFTFLKNSSVNSLVPSILWYLIVFIPVAFCILFLIAAVYYRNNDSSKILGMVMLSPLVVLLPLFLSATSITSPSIIIGIIFIAAWIVTLLISYRQFTKRNALITLAIFFTQVLASFLMIYGFIFNEVTAQSLSSNLSLYYNPIFLIIWFGILVLIPILVKGFERILEGKIKILGIFFAVGVAVLFQIYFFNLFSTSVYAAYLLHDAEIYIGSGFFFFYTNLLLIPLFFIFGYFQIGLARWLYRSFRDYGQKIKRPNTFRIVGGILAIIFIFGLVAVYYIFLYNIEDYQNMFAQVTWLFNGKLIYYFTNPSAYPIPLKSVLDEIQLSSLAITMGLLFYSSYRGAYNLSLFADQIEDPYKNIKRLGLFNFIIFTSPRSYKTRILFGFSLIFVFLGISVIFAFMRIHSYLFPIVKNVLILFNAFDGLKLGISIIGMFIAIAIFLYFIFKGSQVKSEF